MKKNLPGADNLDWAEFGEVLQELRKYSIPDPTPAMTERILAQAREALPAAQGLLSKHSATAPLAWLKLSLRQVSIFENSFWLASFLVIALGLWISLSVQVLFSILAPVVAALGTAYAFRCGNVIEIELTCPVTTYQIILGRMMVVLIYNVLLGLSGSLIMVGNGVGLVFSFLVVQWLAPMLLLTGVALVTSLWINSLVSGIASMGLWVLILTARFDLVKAGWLSVFAHLATPVVGASIGAVLIVAGMYSAPRMGKRNPAAVMGYVRS